MVYKMRREKVEEFMNNMMPKQANVRFEDDYVFIDITIPNEESDYTQD